MISSEKITIVVTIDNKYVVLTAVLFKSIELNHKSNELISFIIVDDGISEVNKKKLVKSIDPVMSTLSFVKSSEVKPPDVKIPVDQTMMPLITYLRLFSPYAVDSSCEKLIYMDVDMIAYDDISKVYNIDLGDKVFGAVQDYQLVVNSPTAIKNFKELGIPAETKYFNAGLLLINREKWIEEHVATKVIQCMNDNKEHVLFADQYGLNVTMHNKWKEIDRVWNRSDLFDYLPEPSLVHFLDIKPIYKSCFSLQKHKDEFFRILSLTEFKDFKPKSNYQRLFKKGFIKAKKIAQSFISLS